MNQGRTYQRVTRRSAGRLVRHRRCATALAVILIGVVVLAACGGDDDERAPQDAEAPTVAVDPPRDSDASRNAPAAGDENSDEDPGAPVTLAVGPGLSVQEAIDSTLDQVLLVNGFIVVTSDVTRLCEALAESFPPQCGGTSLVVVGLDLELVDALERSGDVQWTNFSFQVLGVIVDGTLIVSTTSQG